MHSSLALEISCRGKVCCHGFYYSRDHRMVIWRHFDIKNSFHTTNVICFQFMIKGFRTIVFILIIISSTFRPICRPAFFRCLSNSGTTRNFDLYWIPGVACSDSVNHNRVQVLRIPILLLACCQDWTCNLQMIVYLEASGTNAYNRYAMFPAGHNNNFSILCISWLLVQYFSGFLIPVEYVQRDVFFFNMYNTEWTHNKT